MNEDFAAITVIIGRVQTGDRQAAEQLVRIFAGAIHCEVHRHLGARERHAIDADGIEQDVLLNLWKAVRSGKSFENTQGLKGYLKVAVENKLHKAHRYCHQRRRDVDREVRLDEETRALELAAVQLAPEDELAEEDKWERWLDKQPSYLQDIAMALRQGQTLDEIAQDRGVSVKTIRRARENIRESLSEIYPPVR